MKREPTFKSEADLCAAFIAWAGRSGWTAYAETEGHDILLVSADGTQIGVQAKLRFNIEVLSQCVEGDYFHQDVGPDFRAVLVPNNGHGELCAALGLTLIRSAGMGRSAPEFYPHLPEGADRERWQHTAHWHYCNYAKRHDLPDYIPDVPAGASAPVRLTPWKVGALEICAVLELRGFVTRADFKLAGIDHRRWINENHWLKPGEQPGQYVRGPALRFAEQHPTVYQQVRADVEKRLNGQPALGARELTLL